MRKGLQVKDLVMTGAFAALYFLCVGFRPVMEYALCPSWSSNLWWDGLHASTKQDQKIRSYQSLGNRDGRIFLLIWPFLCGLLARLDFWLPS